MDDGMMSHRVQHDSQSGAEEPFGMATALSLAILAAILFSCGEQPIDPEPQIAAVDQPADPREWPAGTVLGIGEVPISLADVNRIAAWVALITPAKVLSSQQRTALTSVLLERAALINHFPDTHAQAIAAAHDQLAALANLPADQIEELDGGWSQLTLPIWGNARDLEVGVWSGPFEGTGVCMLMRVSEARPGKLPINDQFTLEVIPFRFVPPDFDLEALDKILRITPLIPVDSTIADLIPASWRYRMQTER